MSHLAKLAAAGESAFANPQALTSQGPALLQILADAALAQQMEVSIPACAGGFERRAGAPFHTWPEVFIQIAGVGHFTCARCRISLAPGTAVIIPPGTPHAEVLGDRQYPGRQLVLMYHPEAVGIILAEGDAQRRPISRGFLRLEDDLASSHIVGLIRHWSQSRSTRQPRQQAVTSALLGAALARSAESLAEHRGEPTTDSAQALVRRCQWVVANGLSDHHLSVATIAERLGIHADYCSRRFAASAGEALSHYINRLRCQHAAELLATSDLKVAAIAWACGYTDAGYFARVFSRFHGLRPRAWRDRNRA